MLHYKSSLSSKMSFYYCKFKKKENNVNTKKNKIPEMPYQQLIYYSRKNNAI